MLPGEYVALGTLPEPFTIEDVVSIATLVGGIFGNGGGDQLNNAVLYEQLVRRFGPEHRNVAGSPERVPVAHAARRHRRRYVRGAGGGPKRPDHSGFGTLMSFVDPADPEAPTTVRGHSFPYQTLPKPSKATLKTLALPDRGSVAVRQPRGRGGGPARGGPRRATGEPRPDRRRAGRGRERRPRPAVVPARHVQRAADQRSRTAPAGIRSP